MAEPSSWIALLVGIGFLVLIVLVIRRMTKGREIPEILEEEAKPPPEKKPEKIEKKVEEEKVEKKPEVAPPPPEEKKLVVIPERKPLFVGLEKTRKEGFVGKLVALFKAGKIDESLLAQAEEALLTADIGVSTTYFLLDAIKTEFKPRDSDLAKEMVDFLKSKILGILSELPHGAPVISDQSPFVIMVAGVNGTGKTTTIAKLAYFYKQQGKKVILGAGDTFRAAGTDQLAIWGERVGVPVVVGKEKADPASVIFDTAKRAKEEQFDIMIADTAGRLHTNVNLVDELKKVHKVLGKVIPNAPHEVLLVLDATMGQNAVRQAEIFKNAVAVTGITLAKLDGTAKGGVILSIVKDMKIPIRFVGVGETMEDLRVFDPKEFVDALFAED